MKLKKPSREVRTLAELNRHLMQKSYNKFLRSAVALPIMAAHLAFSPLTGAVSGVPTVAAIFPEQNGNLSGETVVNPRPELVAEAAKIDAYLAKRKSPLAGHGLQLAKAAEDNGFTYSAIAALVTIESNAGLMACHKDPENIGGYMSCKGVDFDSYDEAIDVVARTLGGKIESSAYHYEGKSFAERLVTYNGAANPLYTKKIFAVMNQIDQMEIPTDTSVASTTQVKA